MSENNTNNGKFKGRERPSSGWQSASERRGGFRDDRRNNRSGDRDFRGRRDDDRRGGFGGDRRRDDRFESRGGFRDDRGGRRWEDGGSRGFRDERRDDRGGRRWEDGGSRGFRDERRDDRGGRRWEDRDSRPRRDDDRRGGFGGDRRRDDRFESRGNRWEDRDSRGRRDNDRRDDRRGGFRDDRRRGNNRGEERNGRFNDRSDSPSKEYEVSERTQLHRLQYDIPESITAESLDASTRQHLRNLNKENSEVVARHLAYAGEMMDIDPEVAYQHAKAAFSRAARIDVVREALGLTAYVTERYAEALSELRTYRRMSDDFSHVAIEADAERGLGRSEKALRFIEGIPLARLDADAKIELAIVASGAKADMGDSEAGLAVLNKILVQNLSRELGARVELVKADRLEELGRIDEAKELREQWTSVYEGNTEDVSMVFDLNDVLDEAVIEPELEPEFEDSEDWDDAAAADTGETDPEFEESFEELFDSEDDDDVLDDEDIDDLDDIDDLEDMDLDEEFEEEDFDDEFDLDDSDDAKDDELKQNEESHKE